MNVRLMQQIDYWLGVPLCALFALQNKIIPGLFLTGSASTEKSSTTHDRPERILFIELSEMGSAFLAFASLKKAVERVGKENVYFLIFEKNRESIDILDIIPKTNVITILDKDFASFATSTLKALATLRNLKLSSVLDLELFSRATAIISHLCGAPQKIGFHNFTEEGLYRGDLLTHPVYLNNHYHIAQSFLALTEALEISSVKNEELPLLKKNIPYNDCTVPTVHSSTKELEIVKAKIKKLSPLYNQESSKLIVLNPDPGLLHLRGWSVENYQQLALKFLENDENNLLLIMGLPRSSSFAKKVFPVGNPQLMERCIDFCGQTDSLKEVVTLFHLSHCLISNDSGPGHLASLSGIPAVVLFGPESPKKYGPLGSNVISLSANLACSPCYSPANHRHSICTNNQCMKEITVDSVFKAAIKVMA